MEEDSLKRHKARYESAKFLCWLIDELDLDDEDLMAITGTLFRDAVIASLTLDPPQSQEDEEPEMKALFESLLENCVHLWRRGVRL